MTSLTAWFLWAERLSMTTMASGFCSRRTGSTLVWRKSTKTGMVVAVVTAVIVTTPSRPRAPRTVRRFQLTGASLHARSPPRHVRQNPTLIQEDQSVRIDCRNFFAELIAFGGDIRPPLLTRPQSLFLTTKPWRRNARHILDSLISSPVIAVKAWVYSARVASFFAATSERNTAPSSS